MAEDREHEFLLKQMAASIASGMYVNRDKVPQIPDETKDEAIVRKSAEMALSIDEMVDRKLTTRKFYTAARVRDHTYPEHRGHEVLDNQYKGAPPRFVLSCGCRETLEITDKQYHAYAYGEVKVCGCCGSKMSAVPGSSCPTCNWVLPR